MKNQIRKHLILFLMGTFTITAAEFLSWFSLVGGSFKAVITGIGLGIVVLSFIKILMQSFKRLQKQDEKGEQV